MFTSAEAPQLLFTLAVLAVLAAVVLFALYWVIRLAVRDALEDTENRQPGQSQRGAG